MPIGLFSRLRLQSSRYAYALANATPALPTVHLSGANSQNEGDSGTTAYTYTVTRSDTTGAVSVPWSFAAGTTSADDFVGGSYPAGGTVDMADGVATGTFTVNVQGDTTVESDEDFTVSIAAPSGYALGAPSSATGTILNDDATPSPSFTADPTITDDGTPMVGETLTGNDGTIADGTVSERNWYLDGTLVATGSTYTPDAAGDVTFEVVATGPGGTTTGTSVAVTVAAAPAIDNVLLADNGDYFTTNSGDYLEAA